MSLVVENITKRFASVLAVDKLSMEIPRGTMFGLLGPNGAGKTTTVRVILSIIKPDDGRVTWNGKPFGRHQSTRFGYLPEERGLYPKMRVHDHLVFLGEINGLDKAEASKRATAWMERFGIAEYARRKVDELSKGNQQKVQIIAALLHEPEIVFLDEPFTGLDPVNSEILSEVLKEGNAKGQTVVLLSHRMEQIEELCSNICIINHGRAVLKGELRSIQRSMGRDVLKVSVEGAMDFWRSIPGLSLLDQRPDYVELRMSPDVDSDNVLAAAMRAGKVTHFELCEPSLQQIFVSTVGKEQTNGEALRVKGGVAS